MSVNNYRVREFARETFRRNAECLRISARHQTRTGSATFLARVSRDSIRYETIILQCAGLRYNVNFIRLFNLTSLKADSLARSQ